MTAFVQFINGNQFPCTDSPYGSCYQIGWGGECWATVFNETAAEVLGFSADTYVSMTTMEERYASLSPLRGARVMVTIKKRVKDAYVNYTVSKLEVIDANIE